MCEVEIRMMLPDGSPLTIRARRSISASLFFTTAQRRLQMSREGAAACSIFELLDNSFGERVRVAMVIRRVWENDKQVERVIRTDWGLYTSSEFECFQNGK